MKAGESRHLKRSRLWRKAGKDYLYHTTKDAVVVSADHPNSGRGYRTQSNPATSGISLQLRTYAAGQSGGNTDFAIVIPPSEFRFLIAAMYWKNPEAVADAIASLSNEQHTYTGG